MGGSENRGKSSKMAKNDDFCDFPAFVSYLPSRNRPELYVEAVTMITIYIFCVSDVSSRIDNGITGSGHTPQVGVKVG